MPSHPDGCGSVTYTCADCHEPTDERGGGFWGGGAESFRCSACGEVLAANAKRILDVLVPALSDSEFLAALTTDTERAAVRLQLMLIEGDVLVLHLSDAQDRYKRYVADAIMSYELTRMA